MGTRVSTPYAHGLHRRAATLAAHMRMARSAEDRSARRRIEIIRACHLHTTGPTGRNALVQGA
eukprot:10593711-Alexandrium_andersonii.AAC.1